MSWMLEALKFIAVYGQQSNLTDDDGIWLGVDQLLVLPGAA
jgi:hypothetical protein